MRPITSGCRAAAALSVVFAIVIGFGGPVHSRGPARTPVVITTGDALLDRLVGQWVLLGTIGGKRTMHDVTAEWTLNRKYVRLDETSRDRDARGRPAYQATIFVAWDRRIGRYVCIWLDSTGIARGGVTCTADPGPNAIPFVFRDEKGRVFFENTFLYEPAARRWTWALDDVDHDKRTAFARVTLLRR